MIDLMKRLAELDSKNSNVVKEALEVSECGMMPEMGMGMSQPHSPASINMTAASGEELSGMLRDIMSLAGMSQHSDAEMPMGGEPAAQMLEPAGGPAGAPQDATSTMRSVIDKLNPMDGDDADTDGVNTAHGDIDNDGDHDMDDHEVEKDEGYYKDPDGDEDSAADQADQADNERRGREEELGEYDNTPADPNKKNKFNANQFANQQNQPGQGDRMDGTSPKAYADMNEAVKDLFAEYKKFVSEN